jgi:hypothetical protein
MSNKKQSSIEWLEEQLKKGVDFNPLDKNSYLDSVEKIFEQAKAMNRSEIEDAYDRKVINEKQNWFIRGGKHYYDLHYMGEQNQSVSIENNI